MLQSTTKPLSLWLHFLPSQKQVSRQYVLTEQLEQLKHFIQSSVQKKYKNIKVVKNVFLHIKQLTLFFFFLKYTEGNKNLWIHASSEALIDLEKKISKIKMFIFEMLFLCLFVFFSEPPTNWKTIYSLQFIVLLNTVILAH